MKLIITIILIVYNVGLLWFVYCNITMNWVPESDDLEDTFLTKFTQFSTFDYLQASLALTYYLLTTLSTIGFGDFHPRSDYERMAMAFIMLFGVAIFSYVMGNFIEILNKFKLLDQPLEQGESLSKFLGLLHRFNKNQHLNKKFKDEIE